MFSFFKKSKWARQIEEEEVEDTVVDANCRTDGEAEEKYEGTKRAIIVGCNYTPSRSKLNGCCNDAVNMCEFLINENGYSPEHITLLVDDHVKVDEGVQLGYPLASNIIEALVEMSQVAEDGDRCLFVFSGHGGLVDDRDGDEDDWVDEVLLPADFENAGCILDDTLYAIVSNFPSGSRFFAIVDACHSGMCGTKWKPWFDLFYPDILVERDMLTFLSFLF